MPDDLTAAGLNSLLLTTRDAAGHEHAYLLDARTGLPASNEGRTGHTIIGTPLVTVQNASPGQTPGGATVQATHTSLWQLDGERIRQLESRTYTRQLGRLSWREMTEEGAR
jgi:type IV pilus assembly protein PilY1